MSTIEEKNTAVVSKFMDEYWSKLNPDVVDETCADNVYQYYPMNGQPLRGKDALKNTMKMLKTVIPDLNIKLHGDYGYIAKGNYVFARFLCTGTHTGIAVPDFIGFGPLPENSGRKIKFTGMVVFTLKDGKIIREIGEEGALTGLQQLELIPKAQPNDGGKDVFFDSEAA